MALLDLALLLAFMAYAVGSGLWHRRAASRDLRSYFLADRSLAGWQAGTSMAATQFAADTPLLVTGLLATAGIFAVWRLWIYGLAFLLLAFVLAGPWRRAGALTDAELCELRYSGRGALALRVVKAVYYGTIINCAVLAMVLVAAVRIAEVFLPWHAWLPSGPYAAIRDAVAATGLDLASGATALPPAVATADNLLSILAIVAFTTAYSTTGGLRSVVATDVVQLALALVGTAAYAWVVASEAGGLAAIPERLAALYGAADAQQMLSWRPRATEALGPFLVVVSLQWLFQMNSDGTGYLAQRTMACRSTRDAQTAGVLFAWLQIVLRSLLWLVIGIGLLVVVPIGVGDADAAGFVAARELTYVTGIRDLLPPGLRGLVLVGLLAALASTVDTHLNWGASYWSNDLYRRGIAEGWLGRHPSDRELVVVARLSNLVLLVLALVVMANLGSIQQAWTLSLLFGAGTGSVLLLRWVWERITLWSELAAMATSLVVAPVLLATTEAEWTRLAVMAATTTLAAVAAAWWGPATDPDVLTTFYARVRPPGFWRRTAARAGTDPGEASRALGRGLVRVAAGAGSLFLTLVGVGQWLLPAPGTWMLGPLLMVVGAVVLVPAWWRPQIDVAARQRS